MSQNSNRGSKIFVCILLVTIAFLVMIGSVTAGSNDQTVNRSVEDESIAYLPFITYAEVDTPDGPTLISPDDKAVLQTLIPKFIWDMGSHPEGTTVWSCLVWGLSPDELNGCYSSGGPSTGIVERVAFFNLEPDTLYYWRVGFVYDGDYDDIHWSETRTFTTGPEGGVILPPPTHTSPPDGSAVPMDEAVIKWAEVDGAVEYHVLVHDVGEDRNYGWYTTVNQINLSSQAWWGIEPGDVYEWSVTARNDYAWGEKSEPWSLSVLPSTSRESDNEVLPRLILRTKDGTEWIDSQD